MTNSREKKTICFIAQNQPPCKYVTRQLSSYFSEHANVFSWCVSSPTGPLENVSADLFLISSYAVLNAIQNHLPAATTVIVAERSLNIENLDRLFELTPGMSVVVVGSSEETALLSIEILKEFGFDFLSLSPWHPGADKDVFTPGKMVLTMGLSHLVPEKVENIIELGPKPIALQTVDELIDYLGMPREILNEVSSYYIQALLDLSFRRQKVANINKQLRLERDTVLATVSEAIIAVNQNNSIVLFNPACENIFDFNSDFAIGKDAGALVPQIDFLKGLEAGKEYQGEIVTIRNNHYVVTTRTARGEMDQVNGVVATLTHVSDVQKMETKVRSELRRKGHIARYTFDHIQGTSEKLKEAITLSKQFAKSDLSVLIEAESGCGKELLAQSIHNGSNRYQGPFLALNFAALSVNLVESELFGYEEGAFSGAQKGGKSGLFEEAHRGTIFLDEIGDAPLETQKKLLRVLEERVVRRVGGNTLIPIDVRVISATNKDLNAMVDQGQFRADLFYRLNELPVALPPLRERSDDIFLLVNAFAEKYGHKNFKRSANIDRFFRTYSWPGNIRELQNVVRYICHLLPANAEADCCHIPEYLKKKQQLSSLQEFTPRAITVKREHETIIASMEAQGLLGAIQIILQAIQGASVINRGIGRHGLMQYLEEHGQPMSEYGMRNSLQVLGSLGLVDTGTTRQGSRINEKGIRFLGNLEAYMQRI